MRFTKRKKFSVSTECKRAQSILLLTLEHFDDSDDMHAGLTYPCLMLGVAIANADGAWSNDNNSNFIFNGGYVLALDLLCESYHRNGYRLERQRALNGVEYGIPLETEDGDKASDFDDPDDLMISLVRKSKLTKRTL